MGYSQIYNLLGINNRGGGFGGPGHSRSVPYNPYTGWANKDDRGNSSIAQHNRQILNKQAEDKARQEYERDLKKQYGDNWQSKARAAGTDWNSLSRSEQGRRAYEATLSSSERNARERNRREEAMDNAREALRDYVKQQEAKAKDAGETWNHDDAEKARKEFKDRQESGEGEDVTDDETKANTQDKAAEKSTDGSTDNTLTPDQRLTLLENKFETHIGNPSAHHIPYYA